MTRHRRSVWWGGPALLVVAGMAPSRLVAQVAPATAQVERQILVTSEPGLQFSISPKGQHLAAVALRGSRQVVVHDGVDGPRFDEIVAGYQGLVWSPDGRRLAYIGRSGQDYVYVMDGKELMRLPGNLHPHIIRMDPDIMPVFSPNGRHLYFSLHTAKSGSSADEWYNVVIDGKLGPEGFSVSQPVWSVDGEHHMYVIESRRSRGQYALVVDGKLTAIQGGDAQFSGDGLHVFTKLPVPRTNAMDILADGKPLMRVVNARLYPAPVGPAFLAAVTQQLPNGSALHFLTAGSRKLPGSDCPGQGYKEIRFTPDGRHYSAVCQPDPSSAYVYADGRKGLDYREILGLTFTGDGRAVYQARSGGKNFVVVGDKESNGYQSIFSIGPQSRAEAQTPGWLPPAALIGGNRVGFVALTGTGGNSRAVVVDGKVTMALNASDLSFSPDGSRYAYIVGVSGRQLVVDGVEHKGIVMASEAVNVSSDLKKYVFSPDGKHVAYFGVSESDPQGRGISLNGKFLPTPGLRAANNLTFTPDSKHLLWLAGIQGAPRMAIYVDGKSVAEVDQNMGMIQQAEAWWSMGADGVLTFIAQDGDAMKRFKITPGSGGSVEQLLTRGVRRR